MCRYVFALSSALVLHCITAKARKLDAPRYATALCHGVACMQLG